MFFTYSDDTQDVYTQAVVRCGCRTIETERLHVKQGYSGWESYSLKKATAA